MILDNAVYQLKINFPTFDQTYDGDDNAYLVYGSFGSYILDLINLFVFGEIAVRNYFYSKLEKLFNDHDLIHAELVSIFLYIDKMFIENDKDLLDILNTCIFEALMGNDYSYDLSRHYFSKDTYNHYLKVTQRVSDFE